MGKNVRSTCHSVVEGEVEGLLLLLDLWLVLGSVRGSWSSEVLPDSTMGVERCGFLFW